MQNHFKFPSSGGVPERRGGKCHPELACPEFISGFQHLILNKICKLVTVNFQLWAHNTTIQKS